MGEGKEPEASEPEGSEEGDAPVANDAEHQSLVLGMARQGSLNFAGAIFNQSLRFGLTFLVASLLGATTAGLYFQSYAFLAFLSVVASGAFTDTLTRFVAVHRADGDDAGLRGTIRLGLVTTTAVATVIGLALYWWAPALAMGPFHDPRLSPFLRFVAVALPATAYTDAALAATQGFKTMKPYASINLFFEPACRIVLTVVLLLAGWGLVGLMVALLITNCVSAVLASIALRRLMGRPHVSPRYEVKEIFSFSVPSWLSNLASNGLLWADIIILSIYASSAEVAIYQVATRLTLLATVFIQPVTNSFAPRIADFWRRKRFDLMKKTFKLITSWVVRLSLPSFVVLLIFPRQLLGLFGPEYEAGVTVTRIMTVAWLLNAASGPCGYVLTMSGRPKVQMGNYSAALILNVALNIVLIPRFGITGAATAWATTILMLTVTRVLQVWVFARMLPFSRDLLKGFYAAIVAGVGGLATSELIDGELRSLFVGVVVVGITYVFCIRVLGLEEDDRLVLDALRQRFRIGHA